MENQPQPVNLHENEGHVEGQSSSTSLPASTVPAAAALAEPAPARSYRWLFWALALCGFAADQASKYGVFAYLYNSGMGGQVVVVENAFYVVAQFRDAHDPGDQPLSFLRTIGGDRLPHVNNGALFGIGSHRDPGQDSNVLFTLISVIAGVGIVIWSLQKSLARDGLLCFALGLILAGTFGNLFDRIVFSGVRDFFWFHLEGIINWPVFNVADCFLVLGAGTLLVQAFFFAPEPSNQNASSEANSNETLNGDAASDLRGTLQQTSPAQ